MSKKTAIEHMNNDHIEIVIEFYKHFGTIKNPTNVKLTDMNEDEMIISSDEGIVRVPFLSKVQDENYKQAIMEIVKTVRSGADTTKLEQEIVDFIDSFQSVLISSLSNENCVISYAPFFRDNDEFYILISEVAEHFESIKLNPDKISIMFLEDEKTAKTIFARKRISFKAKAEFIDEQRDKLFEKLEAKFSNESPIKQLKNMQDFHIVKININKGRFVKGFGAAYDTLGFKVQQGARVNNPHNYKKK